MNKFIFPFVARSSKESHRSATPLELFYDLIFVVAIASVAGNFHHSISADHISAGVIHYLMVFAAIWWAWNQFTWFASAYDNDDLIYRLAVFAQMVGALIIAAGVQLSSEQSEFHVLVIGYVVIRVFAAALWFRAAKNDKERKVTALRYAFGIILCQIGWVLWLFTPLGLYGFALLFCCELLVPYYAEKAKATSWHSEHITERKGLLTIIVLGESILASANTIDDYLMTPKLDLLLLIIAGLLMLFSMWWLYFMEPIHHKLDSFKRTFQWSYGHYLIYLSVAAVGATLSAAIDYIQGSSKVSEIIIQACVATSLCVYLLSLWWCHERLKGNKTLLTWLLALALIGACIFIPRYGVLAMGFVMTGLLINQIITNTKKTINQ